jgi:hypothetical protein
MPELLLQDRGKVFLKSNPPVIEMAPRVLRYRTRRDFLLFGLARWRRWQAVDFERDTQAGIEPVYSEIPSGNITRIGSSSVVVVLERGNLRFGVCGTLRFPE